MWLVKYVWDGPWVPSMGGEDNSKTNSTKPTSPTSPTSPTPKPTPAAAKPSGIPSPTKKMANPHALQLDLENYKNTLLAYYKYMHQLPPQKEWMRFKFGIKMREIFDTKKEVNILGIGSGAGDVDIDFLNEIVHIGTEKHGATGYSVTYQVVEPNSENVQAFRNRVAHKPEYARVTFKWFTGTFDQFVADFRPRAAQESSRFQFVHFVRCFYHIDSEKAFDTTYQTLLAQHGIMCGIGENEEAFWPRMMHFLASHKMEHECFTCSGPVSPNYFLPGWLAQCRVRDWRYESYVQGYKFDVTPMYDAENRDGNYVLDFAMHIKDSRKNVPKEVVEDFFKFLDAHKKERYVLVDGVQVVQKYYPCELGAIMIIKE